VVDLLSRLVDEGIEQPDIFVITPFRIVAQNMRSLLSASDAVRKITDRPWQWARERVGTVHTVQGREAEAVFFILGAPEEIQNGARSWAGTPPNLVNVAVSRAKEALYVIGNRALWQKHGHFGVLSRRLAG
jgi:superfamily I DNA and/or RNA helicase